MSPSYREPNREEKASRSLWGTTSILLALAFLTALMTLLIYGAIQGSQPTTLERPTEVRAAR